MSYKIANTEQREKLSKFNPKTINVYGVQHVAINVSKEDKVYPIKSNIGIIHVDIDFNVKKIKV